MSGKQRFKAAINRERLDPRVVIGLSDETGAFDARVGDAETKELSVKNESAFLLRVDNPFGLARRDGIDLNEILRQDPHSDLADRYYAQAAAKIQTAFQSSDGIFYVLDGGYPSASTPMQYGGYYLEKDRDLLGVPSSRIPVVLYVAGDESPYLDFVSDLPCSVFAWSSQHTGITSADVRAMRRGLQASMDPDSEWGLSAGISGGSLTSREILHV